MKTTNHERQEMTQTTEKAINALLAADSTVSKSEVEAIMSAVKGERPQKDPVLTPYTCAEAAAIIGCCKRTVQHYANKGQIRRVFGAFNRTGKGNCKYNREDCERIARGVYPNKINHAA